MTPVNGPRNLPSLGRAKFPTLAGVVISLLIDRCLHFSGGGRGAFRPAKAVPLALGPSAVRQYNVAGICAKPAAALSATPSGGILPSMIAAKSCGRTSISKSSTRARSTRPEARSCTAAASARSLARTTARRPGQDRHRLGVNRSTPRIAEQSPAALRQQRHDSRDCRLLRRSSDRQPHDRGGGRRSPMSTSGAIRTRPGRRAC